jgi:hypothetical protein
VVAGEPFPVGTAVVWRSRPDGDVGYVIGCRVLLDEPDVLAVVQPTGAPVMRRNARRGGPNGRSFIPGTWDGSRRASRWDRPPTVRLHPVGRPYSVMRSWIVEAQRFEGWYVNLEQPWRRTAVGFDSRDDVLDVVVSDDLRTHHLKDADELAFTVQVGMFTPAEARSIHVAADTAVADLAGRRWPFEETAWSQPLPPALLEPTTLPIGWDAS